MIPKKVHLIWQHNTELPDKFKSNIERLKELNTNLEVILWTRDKRIFRENQYSQHCLENDLIREYQEWLKFEILRNYGGIVIDVQVEHHKPLPDSLFELDFAFIQINANTCDTWMVLSSQMNSNILEICGLFTGEKLINFKKDRYTGSSILNRAKHYLHDYNLLNLEEFSTDIITKKSICSFDTSNNNYQIYNLVPRTIHHIWLGDKNKIDKTYITWLDECKELNPQYNFKFWHYEEIPDNDFCKKAKEVGELNLIGDYLRASILYEHGGIYFDFDVKHLKPIPEKITKYPFSIARPSKYWFMAYFLASEKKSEIIEDVIKEYHSYKYIKEETRDEFVEKWQDGHVYYKVLLSRKRIDNDIKDGSPFVIDNTINLEDSSNIPHTRINNKNDSPFAIHKKG